MRQMSGREIRCLYNRTDEIFAKLDDNKLLVIASKNPDEKVPQRLLEQGIQTTCILRYNTYLTILENGELLVWGKGCNEWDFSISEDKEVPKKVLSMTPNSFHNAVSLVLEDGCTILQSGFLTRRDQFPSKHSFKLSHRVKRIYSTLYTHVAWLDNGTITVWGELYGGTVPVMPKNTTIRSIHQTRDAFALLLENGRLLVFGNPNWGGRLPVSIQNRTVIDIVSTSGSFLALLDDHTIFSWESDQYAQPLPRPIAGSRVKSIFSSQCLFMALLENGSLFCWRTTDTIGKTFKIPEDRRVKNVISIDEAFVIQLDNDKLYLLKESRESNYQLMVMAYRLPFPEGRHLAVMDREL